MSYQTFKKGETVIIYDGGKRRNSVELAQVGADSHYTEDNVLITFGNFNTAYSRSSVHKLPSTIKKQLKAELEQE